MSKLDTEQWKFYANMGYSSKPQPRIQCPSCGGRGRIGGGFKDPDDPEDCWKCVGTGVVEQDITEPRPDVPSSLIQHMKKAYNEWYDDYFKENK